MGTFEEDQEKIKEIRANALKSGSKVEADKKIKEYYDNKVSTVRTKLSGRDKSNKSTEDNNIKTYYDDTVPAERKKVVGKQ